MEKSLKVVSRLLLLFCIIGSLFVSCKADIEVENFTFITNGDSTVDSQLIENGNKASRPTIEPTKEYFNFDNWYTAPTGGDVFYFDSTNIITDTTVYAQWTLKEITMDTTITRHLTIPAGQTLTIPENVLFRIFSGGTITIESGGILECNGAIDLDTSATLEGSGTFLIKPNSSFSLNSGALLTIDVDKIVNEGNIYAYNIANLKTAMEIIGNVSFVGYGTLDSGDTLTLGLGILSLVYSKLTIASGATLIIPSASEFFLGNSGELIIDLGGALRIDTGGILRIDSTATYTNNGIVTNDGEIIN